MNSQNLIVISVILTACLGYFLLYYQKKSVTLSKENENLKSDLQQSRDDYFDAHNCNIENLKAAKAAGTRNIILLSVMILASLILCFHFIKKWWKSRAQK